MLPAKPTVTPLRVVGTTITQDAEGRYSLNDLHRAAVAAGKANESQRPGSFLRAAGVRAFVDALDAPSDAGIPASLPTDSVGDGLTAGIPAVRPDAPERGGLTAQIRAVRSEEGPDGGPDLTARIRAVKPRRAATVAPSVPALSSFATPRGSTLTLKSRSTGRSTGRFRPERS